MRRYPPLRADIFSYYRIFYFSHVLCSLSILDVPSILAFDEAVQCTGSNADFLCYVTPSEHLRLPTLEDVREGVIASRIAAHAGDIAKGVKGAMDWDMNMSRARKALNWDEQIRLSIDPQKARALRESSPPSDKDVCTMCGSLCAIKVSGEGK